MSQAPGTRHRITGTGWDGLLAPGERILWQGRPGAGPRMTRARLMRGLVGLVFAGFALLWMILAAQGGGAFWAFGLIHFSVGLGMAVSVLAGPELRRRHSWYTLTDRRAFVATDYPVIGRRLLSYPVGPGSHLRRTHDDPAAVYFASHSTRRTRGHARQGDAVSTYSATREWGFEGLSPREADLVHGLAGELIRGKTVSQAAVPPVPQGAAQPEGFSQ